MWTRAATRSFNSFRLNYGVSARYNYPLSERTSLYAGAGYGQTKDDDTGNKDQLTQVYCGLVHTF